MTDPSTINPSTGKAFAINPSSGVWDDNYFDANYGAANRAQQHEMQAYDNLGNTVKDATSTYAKGLNANENAAFGDYLNVVQTQPTSVDFYRGQLKEAGVPQLQKTSQTLQGQIYDLQDTLRRVEPNIAATTGNSLVTESQRQGLVTHAQKPLTENLGWLGQSLGRVTDAITSAKGDAIALTNLNSADQAKVVDAFKTKLALAQSQGDRALQAFTTDITNTLNVTLAKLHRGEQVSDTEAANAFTLMQMKQKAELDIKTAQATASKSSQDRYINLGDGAQLYDTQTGQIVASNAKDKAGGAASANPWG